MATRIIMPKLGMAMKEGMLAKWLVDDGGRVALDDTIAVIVTKKITYELKAPAEGVLHHRARAQDNRPVGAVIGYVAAPGEAVPEAGEVVAASEVPVTKLPAEGKAAAPAAPAPAAAAPKPGDGFVVATPAARRLAREAGIPLQFIPGSGPGGRVTEQDFQAYLKKVESLLVTPAARKLAQERQVDLTTLSGTGAGGRITEDDVQSALAGPAKAAAPVEAAPAVAAVVPMVGMRQMIAENMLQSLHSMAQVTVTTEVDVSELVDLRELLKKTIEVTYTDLIVRAATLALRKHPRLNAALDGDQIRLLPDIHIGVGVAMDEGLIVPVIQYADRLSVAEIGAKVRDLAARARSGALEIDEVAGSTFTITNLGAYGIDAFTPIINPPEVAILGVGRIVEKPAIYRGEIARRSMMVLSLTFDHRLVDGAPAAAFLQSLAEILAHPYLLKDR
jgi:pyruvate dehydrogenase E2 component (dihydrolipoamide acetyltransferase)